MLRSKICKCGQTQEIRYPISFHISYHTQEFDEGNILPQKTTCKAISTP